MTSPNQGLSPNDQGRWRRENLGMNAMELAGSFVLANY